VVLAQVQWRKKIIEVEIGKELRCLWTSNSSRIVDRHGEKRKLKVLPAILCTRRSTLERQKRREDKPIGWPEPPRGGSCIRRQK
jgi:hypothetical protein